MSERNNYLIGAKIMTRDAALRTTQQAGKDQREGANRM